MNDVTISDWFIFHKPISYDRGREPIAVRLNRIIAVSGHPNWYSEILVEGCKEPIKIDEDSQYVQDVVDTYFLFKKTGQG